MSARARKILKNLIIFNSTFGPKEGEEEQKLLYYYPKNEILDKKIKDIGLCEAIIKFTSAFTSNTDVKNVVTQKTVQIYYQPESEFWMILTLYTPFEVNIKSSTEQADDAQDFISRAILQQMYESFKLLHGTFWYNFHENSIQQRDRLMSVLDEYFSSYLKRYCIYIEGNFNVSHSVNYFPLDQLHFLRVQEFSNMLEATFSKIATSVFLFHHKVVWSGLPSKNLFIFYEYLRNAIFPKLEITNDMVESKFHDSSDRFYVIGPPGSLLDMHLIWICGLKYTLIIYKTNNCMNCLFIRDEEIPNYFFKDLSLLMGTQMSRISEELTVFSKSFSKEKQKQEFIYKYIFINELTQKHEGSIKNINKDSTAIPLDVMNILSDIYTQRTKTSSEEVVVKTHNDFWIVRKTSNFRHYFLVSFKPSSTLIDVTEETKQIVDKQIRSIFFEK